MTRPLKADGFTLIELLMVVAIFGVVLALAVPGLLRARMSGNEASAIGSLRAINSGQAAYASSCASGGYAIRLEDLAQPPPGAVEGFISPDLNRNGIVKSGYTVSLSKNASPNTIDLATVVTCNGSAGTPTNAYHASANPVTLGGTGMRYFATDARGTLYYDTSAALANPIPPGASTIVQ
jgi:prepilin-type N-terminal cleavage/methylation domain-containing protein